MVHLVPSARNKMGDAGDDEHQREREAKGFGPRRRRLQEPGSPGQPKRDPPNKHHDQRDADGPAQPASS